jgi:hypothetical protein
MPKEYRNDSPAVRLLDRAQHMMRLQRRVLSQMEKDFGAEHQEVKDTVISHETDMKKFVRDTMARLANSQARFADIDLMLQIFFCRHYDDFEIFCEELIGDIVRPNPALLGGIKLPKAAATLSAAEQLEKRLSKIARMPIRALADTVKEELSFDLFVDGALAAQIIYLSDVRNLLTHRYGVVDSHFLSQQPQSGLAVGDRFVVTMEFTRDALDAFAKSAADIQKRASAQFHLRYETRVVGKTEWWEEPSKLPPLPPVSGR